MHPIGQVISKQLLDEQEYSNNNTDKNIAD